MDLAIENTDAISNLMQSLQKYGEVLIALPEDAFDISLGETFEKTAKIFEDEYEDDQSISFFAPVWELEVDNYVEAEEKEEEFEDEKYCLKFSCANFARKNTQQNMQHGFGGGKKSQSAFPQLNSSNTSSNVERIWNEPPLDKENDDDDVDDKDLQRRSGEKKCINQFPNQDFEIIVANAAHVFDLIARRVLTSCLRDSFPESTHEENSILCNLEGCSEEFLERKRSEHNSREKFVLKSKSGTLITRDDLCYEQRDETNVDVFLTCEWTYDPEMIKSKKKNSQFFIELDGPVVRFVVGKAMRKNTPVWVLVRLRTTRERPVRRRKSCAPVKSKCVFLFATKIASD